MDDGVSLRREKVGALFTSEIYTKKNLISRKQPVLNIRYSWDQTGEDLEVSYMSDNDYLKIKEKVEEYINRNSRFLKKTNIEFKKYF